MMMLQLDIFCLKEDQMINQDMGIPVPFEECLVKKFYFVKIDWFSPRSDNPNYTTISSGNEEFVCTDNCETIKQKITHANLIEQGSLLKLN
jgi:hypothetical protein